MSTMSMTLIAGLLPLLSIARADSVGGGSPGVAVTHFLLPSLLYMGRVLGDSCPEGQGINQDGLCVNLCAWPGNIPNFRCNTLSECTLDISWEEISTMNYYSSIWDSWDYWPCYYQSSQSQGFVQKYEQVAFVEGGFDESNWNIGEPSFPVNDGRHFNMYPKSWEEAEERCDSEPTCVGYMFHSDGQIKFLRAQDRTRTFGTPWDGNAMMLFVKPVTTPAPTPFPTLPTADPTTKSPTSAPTTDMYLRVDEQLSRDAAEARCQELYGTSLASIHSQFENDEAYELCAHDWPSSALDDFARCWIGVYFDGEAQTIGWTDGSPVEFANWRDGAPNNGAHCNFIKVNAEWEDSTNCEAESAQGRFLCNAPSVDTLPPDVDTTARPTTGYHYVAAGDPYSADLKSNVAISCEEDSSDQGHYESDTWGFDIHVACCDEEQGSRPGCVSKATYQEAFDHCDSLGLRLCTAVEMVARKTQDAGCLFDRSYGWTSTECSVDGLPLTDEGNPDADCECLDECAGDCDSDADCVGDLVCFQRDSGDDIPPGCFGQPHYSSHDYCYDPAKADASGDPARSIERQQDSGYDVIESGEQVMNDAAEDSHMMAVLVASLAVVAVMAIAVMLYCALCKKEVKVEEENKTVDVHVPSSSIEMSDAPRSTAPISV